ncbi:putative E3 ubiquitin-protein ligase makorin-1 [Acipenser ruthenus]|uniref:RING-type E3 ubiquitin transferase n=1 Tax=Acipenser ruthenus TaxID=7906 RepID=A0A444UI55_ACIRT|nr:putative E3 ubiquitin-protein ligase makorin-1 [Acipenser ruthenus]
MICKYFQKGCCAYGDRCRYDHTKPPKQDVLSGPKPMMPAECSLAPDCTPDLKLSGQGGEEGPHSSSSGDWVNAAEFVPGQLYCGRDAFRVGSNMERSCPECRITSNFIIPSEYWVEDKEEKKKLIRKYKDAMSSKPCRYFDAGCGTCPFGGNCFYKHAFPDGRLEEPQSQRRQQGSVGRHRTPRRTPLWDLFEGESNDSFDNEEEEVVTFELGEMLLMLLASGTDDELSDSEDEWGLFHEGLDDYYEVYL